MKRAVVVIAALVALACAGAPREDPAEWLARVEQHRADRDERLRSENGWLTLIGLHWLEAGANTIGSAADNAIVLDVPNIDEVLAGCADAGFHVYPEEHLVTHDGRTGREIGIVDDDGNLVVIYRIESTG